MTERIFDRLFQASDPTLAGRQGLGLRLYICRELVTRQGGRIWATSAVGEGTVLSFTLPIFSMCNLLETGNSWLDEPLDWDFALEPAMSQRAITAALRSPLLECHPRVSDRCN
jgi:hypothetical protein